MTQIYIYIYICIYIYIYIYIYNFLHSTSRGLPSGFPSRVDQLGGHLGRKSEEWPRQEGLRSPFFLVWASGRVEDVGFRGLGVRGLGV